MNYKFINLLYTCLLAVSMLSASHATAMPTQDVVRTNHGQPVRDNFGGCVRTKWMVEGDKCFGYHKLSTKEVRDTFMKMEERVIYFDFDKSNLKDSEIEKLDIIAEALKEYDVRKIKIVGFTDRIGTADYNKKLSHRRASAVKDYLDSKVTLDSSIVTLRAIGEKHQIKDCKGIKNRDSLIQCLGPNRRVEVELDYYDDEHHIQSKKQVHHTKHHKVVTTGVKSSVKTNY